MTQEERQRIETLKKEIRVSRGWRSFCGTLGLLATILIPLSILFGNRTLGLCAVSWIAGSLFAFLSEAAKSKRSELEDEICAIELSSQLNAAFDNAARRAVETSFGPISMN